MEGRQDGLVLIQSEPTRVRNGLALSETPISRSLPVELANLGILVERGLEELLEPYEIGLSEFRVLVALVEQGPSTAVEIAALVPSDSSFISRMVQRLVGKRLLSRRRMPSDRRTVELRATDSGRALVTATRQPLERFEGELLRSVPQTIREDAGAGIAAILANLESRDGPQ